MSCGIDSCTCGFVARNVERNTKMSRLRNVRVILLVSYDDSLLSTEEFCLLYDINKPTNPDFPYWQYSHFELDMLCDDECRAKFRFLKKNDIYLLKDALEILDHIICSNRLEVDGATETLYILLKCFAYPHSI